MSLRLAVLTLMGAGMLLAGSGPAFAHSGSYHVPYRWVRDGTIGWSYTSSVPTAVRTRVLDGLAPWNSQPLAIEFIRVADRADFDPTGCPTTYQQNAIHWRPVAQNYLAVVRKCTFNGGPDEIYSAQMVFDSTDNWYTGNGTPGATQFDVWSVEAHEWGHMFGWAGDVDAIDGHFPDGTAICNDKDPDQFATMCSHHYPGTTFQRTLTSHDTHTMYDAYKPARWFLNHGYDGGHEVSFKFGSMNYQFRAGDWNGDGRDRPGFIYRNWWYLNNGFDDRAETVFAFGSASDVKLVGDWNANGRDAPAVVRPNATAPQVARWYLNHGFDGTAEQSFDYGYMTDVHLSGNWDTDLYDEPAIVRPNPISTHVARWHLNTGYDATANIVFDYGYMTDLHLSGNFDSDVLDEPAIVRPDGTSPQVARWYLNTGYDGTANIVFNYGYMTDRKLLGDWDQDGLDEPAIVREQT